MFKEFFPKSFLLLVLGVLTLPIFLALSSENTVLAQTGDAPGSLTVVDPSGKPKSTCPLKHTDVKAEISGFISRVTVTQEFENSFKEKIEAVYTFPLPQNAAVDDMTMTIGDRIVKGKILPREQAQAVYEAAKSNGQVAALLDQERPNIFTQSVANILPGNQIKITISYVETLKYENGTYEFVFPMVVGPRYVPGNAAGTRRGNGFAPDTDRVRDASRITPRPAPAGMRSGHDISLEVNLDAGLLIDNIESKTHAIDVQRPDPRSARLRLKENATIPNKDFILRYDVAGQAIQDALLTHQGENGSFFTLILQPPERVAVNDVMPKELVFVLDTSGSMEGFPIEKAKETMRLALDNLYPSDTFNLITFAGDTEILFPQPVPATQANLKKAKAFLQSRSGAGGTEMMSAIKAALDPSDDQSHVRIVCFMTDGYVGNDMGIISEVQKHPNARVFAFGIGGSVNRFLLDKMAEAGRGEVEYVALNDDGSAAARRFHERVRTPLLTDISIDWKGMPVTDIYPKRIPDLFGAKPVILTGRFTGHGQGTIQLKGKMAGSDYVRDIVVEFPENMASHDVLAPLWARARVDDLMNQDYAGAQSGNMRSDLRNTITQLGIEFRLMTQFTSFVAVEEMVVTDGGQPRRIDVPVEVPEGVNRETAYGDYDPAMPMAYAKRAYVSGGLSNRLLRAKPTPMPPNSPPTVSNVGVAPAAGAGGGVLDAISARAELPDPVEAQRRELQRKLHPSIFAVVERLRKKETLPSADEAGFVRDGKAEVQVWLTDKSAPTKAKLKELGFEVLLDPASSKFIIGRISIEKLEALAKLDFVSYVAPQR